MIRQIVLGNGVVIPNNIFLAPLAGYTDAAMRRLCVEAGAGLTITEMVSAKGLLYKNKNTAALLQISSGESFVCGKKSNAVAAQLFGSEAEVFGEVIRNSPLLEPFDIIDINMGCPVKKIAGAGEGSALLWDINKAAKIVEASAKATKKPITVKIRIPDPASGLTLRQAILALFDSGAQLVTVHGRTAKMMYSGKADWNAINEAAANSPVPIIGNGDITTVEEALIALSGTCQGIMIGRGAIGNPKLFHQIREFASREALDAPNKKHNTKAQEKLSSVRIHELDCEGKPHELGCDGKICELGSGGMSHELGSVGISHELDSAGKSHELGCEGKEAEGFYQDLGENARRFLQQKDSICLDADCAANALPKYFDTLRGTILRHIQYMEQMAGDHYTLTNMRKHLGYYVKGLPSMREFKNKANTAPTLDELKEIITTMIHN